jgi:predicted amidohydrolase YtcJ
MRHQSTRSYWRVGLQIALGLAIATACAAVESRSSRAAPDLILINGKIFTGDRVHPYAEALAIRGERISATGDSRSILALAGPATRRIDIGGHTVIAGINDAHNHLDVGPVDMVRIETHSDDPSWSELRAALLSQVTATPPGTLLWASFSLAIFNDTRVNRDALDAVSTDHPIWLGADTGHAAILNSSALARAGIHDDIQDPVGGRYERDTSGRLTGVIREYAALDVDRRFADALPDEEALRQLRPALEQDARLGITTLQVMSYSLGVRRAVRLFTLVNTPIRLRIMNMALTTPTGRSTHEAEGLPRHPTGLVGGQAPAL